jgi:hypothetical protein
MKPAKETHLNRNAPSRTNLEFLLLWLMATSNPKGFFMDAVAKGGQRHWKLHDPSDKDPTSVYPHDDLFKVLDWEKNIEVFLDKYVFDNAAGPAFQAVANMFYGSANKVLPRQAGASPYPDHTCPPLSELIVFFDALPDNAKK